MYSTESRAVCSPPACAAPPAPGRPPAGSAPAAAPWPRAPPSPPPQMPAGDWRTFACTMYTSWTSPRISRHRQRVTLTAVLPQAHATVPMVPVNHAQLCCGAMRIPRRAQVCGGAKLTGGRCRTGRTSARRRPRRCRGGRGHPTAGCCPCAAARGSRSTAPQAAAAAHEAHVSLARMCNTLARVRAVMFRGYVPLHAPCVRLAALHARARSAPGWRRPRTSGSSGRRWCR
jgi:hypothetical protein